MSTLFCSQIREEERLEVEPRCISVFLPAVFLYSLHLHTEEIIIVKLNTRHEVLLSVQQANGCKTKASAMQVISIKEKVYFCPTGS